MQRVILLVGLLGCVRSPPTVTVAPPARVFDALGLYRGGSNLEAIAPGNGALWLFTFGDELKSVYAIAVDPVPTAEGWSLKPRSIAQLPTPGFAASVRIEGTARVLITKRASTATRATLEQGRARFDRSVTLEADDAREVPDEMFSAPPVALSGPLLSGGAKDKCWLALLLPAQKSYRVGDLELTEHRAIGDHWGDRSACATSDFPLAGPIKVGGAVADVLAVADNSGIVAMFLFGYMSAEGFIRPDVRRNPTRRAAVLQVITTAWQTNE